MNLTTNFKKLVLWGGLTSIFLSGCGGSAESKPPELHNQAPVAQIIGANLAIEHEQASLRAEADDIDGTISSYLWSVEGADVVLTGASTANVSFIAPNVEQDSSFTIHLTVIDNDGATSSSSMIFHTERIYDTIVIRGLVTDEPLIHPQVTLEIGDDVFTTTATAAGIYTFNKNIEIDERNFDKLVKLTAVGHEQYNPGVKLVSLLESFRTLKTHETSEDYILPIDYFGLNVTNVTTAKYALALAANDNQPIETETQLNKLLDSLEPEAVMEVAGLLKVIIDSADHKLPATVADTLSLVLPENTSVYSDTLDEISAQDLAKAIKQVLADPELVVNPDFDGDGVYDSVDPDIDGDGVLNDDDFFERDNTKSAPEIGMIPFPWDGTSGSWLEFCVRESLNTTLMDDEFYKPLETYKKVSADEVTEIYCSGTGLTDLSQLQYFPNLKVLEMAETEVEDISVISQLTQLEHLLLQDTKVSNFTSLSELTALKTLNLANTRMSDIALLSKLVNLEVLNIGGTNIDDLANIAALTKLKQLDVSRTLVTSLADVATLTNLQVLYAHRAKVVDLPNFSQMPLLTEFTLHHNQISNIAAVASLRQTTTLDLSYNKISELDTLASLTDLTKLDLSHNHITNTDALSSLEKLTSVNLSYNQLNSVNPEISPGTLLAGLESLELLTELNLSHNQLDSSANDLLMLSGLVNLTSLDISNNTLESIAPVNLFTSLADFDASGNNIVSITELSNLTALAKLDLAKNQIADINPLSKLSNLSILLLSNNDISNIDVFNNWQTLPLTLWLGGNYQIDCSPTADSAPATSLSPAELLQKKANEQNISYKSPCDNLIARPAIEEPEQFLTIIDQEETDHFHSAGLGNLGDVERIACMNQIHDGYPLCWVANNDYFFYPQCTAEENEPLMTCTDGPEEGSEYPFNSGIYWKAEPFTVDYDFTLQPDNEFVSTFDNRLLLTLLKTSFAEVDIKCRALSVQGEASCTLTGDFFSGEITWTQDHEDGTYPRCKGELDSSTATCTPGPSLADIQQASQTIDELPTLNRYYNFDLDLSTIEITPVQDRDYPCIPGAICW